MSCVDMSYAFKTTKFDEFNDTNFGASNLCPTKVGDKFEYYHRAIVTRYWRSYALLAKRAHSHIKGDRGYKR